jgi:hypothetical protein
LELQRRLPDAAADMVIRESRHGGRRPRGHPGPVSIPDLPLPAVAAVGLVAGAIVGALAFVLVSPRGLDLPAIGRLLGTAAGIAGFGLAAFGLWRLASERRLGAFVLLVGLGVGWAAGDAAASRFVPGTRTEGTLTIRTVGGHLLLDQAAVCEWAPDRSRVVHTRTRHPIGAVTAYVLALDLEAGRLRAELRWAQTGEPLVTDSARVGSPTEGRDRRSGRTVVSRADRTSHPTPAWADDDLARVERTRAHPPPFELGWGCRGF